MPEEKQVEDQKTDKPQDGAGEEKLLAGKFKSQEAMEEAYKNLERAYHDSTAETKKWKSSVEEMLSATEPRDRESLEADADEFSQKFLENPKPILQEFATEVRKSVIKDVNKYMDARDTVVRFLDENADVQTNPKLFALNLAETDPNKGIADRLSDAREAYNAELDDIRKKAKEKEGKRKAFEKKNKADAVDTGEGAGRDMPAKGESEEESESDDFTSYIEERKAERARISSLL